MYCEGALVNLRPLEMSDLDRVHTWINDREVTRFLNARYPMPLLAEEQWLRAASSTVMDFQHVDFAVETKDGVHIGTVGFHVASAENRTARLGISIGEKAYWSRGYGTDTVVTICRFGFEQMNLNRIDLSVDAENVRAIRCYAKSGFTLEGRLRERLYRRGRYGDQFIMSILRDEFDRLHGRPNA
jgi:RimJ/RimL family protein N-acetyltransferase